MEKKLLKVLKILAVTCIITTFVFSLVVSQDEHHLETCHEDHCALCIIINISQNIISIIIAFVLAIIVGILICFFLSKLHKKQEFFVIFSLISQKVQFNQ